MRRTRGIFAIPPFSESSAITGFRICAARQRGIFSNDRWRRCASVTISSSAVMSRCPSTSICWSASRGMHYCRKRFKRSSYPSECNARNGLSGRPDITISMRGTTEKVRIPREVNEEHASGAKAHGHFVALLYGLKPVLFNSGPFSFRTVFSARFNSLLKESGFQERLRKTVPQRLKPPLILSALCRG